MAVRARRPGAGRLGGGRLDREFGGGRGEQTGTGRLAGIERGGQGRLGFRQAFAATSADPEFSGKIAQRVCAASDGGSDLSV